MPGKSGDCMEGFSKNGELSSNIKKSVYLHFYKYTDSFLK